MRSDTKLWYRRMWWVWLVSWLCGLGHAAAAVAAPAAAVTSVVPDRWVVGQEYTVRISGAGLPAAVVYDFGAGVQVLGTPAALAGGGHSLRVRVAPDAAPGRRVVAFASIPSLTAVAASVIQGRGPAVITIEAAPLQRAVTPPVAVVPTMMPAVLLSVQPTRVRAGGQAQLVFTGQGLQPDMRIDYGAGIQLQPLRALDQNRYTALARIDAGAAAGLRQPQVALPSGALVQVRPGAALQIMAAPLSDGARAVMPEKPPSLPTAGLKVESLYPDRITGGRNYTVMVRGAGFSTGMQLDLGTGINVGTLEVIDAGRARVQLQVEAGAAAGMRFARARKEARLPWLSQSARILVERQEMTRAVPAPKWSAPTFDSVFGVINLEAPDWQLPALDHGRRPTAIPTLRDDTIFQWSERNPGMAEWYEVRFYRGDALLATRKIEARAAGPGKGTALPTFLIPDPELVAKLGEARGPLTRSDRIDTNKRAPLTHAMAVVAGTQAGSAGTQADGAGTQVPKGDLAWEVIGYRSYYQDGVHAEAGARAVVNRPGGVQQVNLQPHIPVTQEVERSERWPLNSPALPTGMSCGKEAGSTLQVMNIDAAAGEKSKGGFSTEVATANHTGDRWKLSGKFNLESSPWAARGALGNSASLKFDNVFIDWGDGTVHPLQLSNPEPPKVPGGINLDDPFQQAETIDLDRMQNPSYFQHAYREVGRYTVRVYQLAEDDLQDRSAANVSMSVTAQATLYGVAQQWQGGAGASDSQRPRGFRESAAAADRAYMVYCNTVDIQPRTDDATNGPLNLVAAKLRGFPEAPGDATPPAGVKVAAAPDNTPRGALQRAGTALLVSGQPQTGVMQRGSTRAGAAGGRSANPVPRFSACDVDLTGGGYLYYFGTGKVRTTWFLDGAKVNSRTEVLEPSWPRPDAQLAQADPGDPLIRASDLLLSPSMPLKPLGKHTLHFETEVIYEMRGLGNLVGLVGKALGSGGRSGDTQLARQLASGMQGAPSLGVLPPRGMQLAMGVPIGVSARFGAASLSGARVQPATDRQLSPVLQLNTLVATQIQKPTGRKPPHWVGSNRLDYQVVNAQDGLACTFEFPVEGGSFTVSGLQDPATGQSRVQEEGGRWSGKGDLNLLLPNGSKIKVPLEFRDWRLAADGVTVEQGSFEVADPFSSAIKLPAASAKLTRLAGTAGKSVMLDLVASLANPNILVAGTDQGPPPLSVKGTVLSPAGDIYAAKLPLPDLNVYDSGFHLMGLEAALDWSAATGSACGAGNDWKGIAFSTATLDAFNFDLTNKPKGTVQGWGIDESGFCGSHKFGKFTAQVQHGSISWDAIDAQASKGVFTAGYQGLRAHVPWLDVDLVAKGATTLMAGAGTQGGGKIKLDLGGDAPRREFGAVSLDADGLALGSMEGVGLVVQAQTTRFDFKADGAVFASGVSVPELSFGMDGKAYFEEGGGSVQVELGGTKGRLSQGVIDLKSVGITAVADASRRLRFDFTGDLTISDALPAATAPIGYQINEPKEGRYAGIGPVTGKFVIHKPFPDAHPSTDIVIRPNYAGPQDGSVASATPRRSVLDALIQPAYAATAHMTYCGDTDIGMFGGPPVKGGFALGYQGGDSYWAASARLSFGPTGVPLVMPFLQLYEIGGGLGYNVAIDSFAGGSSCSVRAKIDRTPVFDASLVVGDVGHFAYGLEGHFTVKTTGAESGARMSYKAWLLRRDWSGAGDFHGYFQYVGGNFDGTLNGRYGFLGDIAYVEAANDAIALHFGDGDWYIHAGTRDNPIKGHLAIIDAGAWMGVGSAGLYAGARGNFSAGAGDCGAVCASVGGDALIEASITPAPHISADGKAHLSAKACAFDICLGTGLDAGVHIAALPMELGVSFGLESCPPGYLNVSLQVLPSPRPGVGGGLCLW